MAIKIRVVRNHYNDENLSVVCPEAGLFELVKAKKHHQDGRFVNPWFRHEAPALRKILKWKISHLREKEQAKIPIIRPDPEFLAEAQGPMVCFLGHATVWVRLAGKSLLFDPIFGNIAGIIRRRTPPPLQPHELPPVDLILISHAHRDHLSLQSLTLLKGNPFLVVPLKTSRYLNLERIIELDWFEEREIAGLRIMALPTQHWSKRSLLDTNASLWCAYLVEADGFRLFFGGDTGYFFGFREIGELYGPFDLALLPSGAFLPRWLMAPFHLSPEEAVRAALDLRAKQAMPIHWGAYRLGDEELDDPPRLFKKAAYQAGLTPLILYPGESMSWPLLSNTRLE